jgi:predicted nuclease with TOPRIM domain
MSVQEPNQYDNVLLTKIKEDNTQLRLNFDKLKDTYEVLQDNYDSVAKKLKLMEEEKVIVPKESDLNPGSVKWKNIIIMLYLSGDNY